MSTTSRARKLESLRSFYVKKTQEKASLFHVWEDGGRRGDSVTPSIYSAEYRTWMVDKLIVELERNGGALLSLGCGNAAVEAEVVRRGYRVLAIDAMPEAVELARQKSVEAVHADIFQWTPEESHAVVYIDGVLGHLYEESDGLMPVLSRIRTWLAPLSGSASGLATLIASNDAPEEGVAAQPAPGVDGFYWLSANYIRDQSLASGFENAETGEFRYDRPLSGERVRSVVTCSVSKQRES